MKVKEFFRRFRTAKTRRAFILSLVKEPLKQVDIDYDDIATHIDGNKTGSLELVFSRSGGSCSIVGGCCYIVMNPENERLKFIFSIFKDQYDGGDSKSCSGDHINASVTINDDDHVEDLPKIIRYLSEMEVLIIH